MQGKSTTTQRVAVIGAGPAGLAAAYQLTKAGVRVDVYEASDQIGGMARSLKLWGHTVDIGPHRFFSKDPRVNALWLEVVGKDYTMVRRQTRIFYRNKFFDYPIRITDSLKKLGPIESTFCIASYIRAKLPTRIGSNSFELTMKMRFGKRLYDHFFRTYSEKLWGTDPANLDSEFALQRIGGLSFWEAAKSAMQGGKNQKHKTLLGEFAYPNKGTGQVYNSMRRMIEKRGGVFHLSAPVETITTSKNHVIGLKLTSRKQIRYDHVISSMPITLLLDRLENVPTVVRQASSKLQFRNTIMVYIKVKKSDSFPDNWIYIHSPDLRMGRVTNFHNWGNKLNHGKTGSVLAVEFWCSSSDDFWRWEDEQYAALAVSEIIQTGLVRPQDIQETKIIRIPRCYPIYHLGYRQDLVKVEKYLSAITDLQIIGRYGAFKYNNQDHSLLMGILAAENVSIGAQHDLWSINSDLEYHESSVITKNGLEQIV